MILLRDFLCTQMLLDRHRVIRAALHRGVITDNHAFLAFDAADAGDHTSCRCGVVIHLEGCELREFEKGGAGIQQLIYPLTR